MNRVDVKTSNEIAKFVNAVNAERISASHRRLGVALALLVAVLATLALLQWAEPCEGAALCAALITPTRSGWWRRLMLRLEAWRLRVSLADHEATLERVEIDLQALPIVRNNLQRNVDWCRTQLADCHAQLQQGPRP